MSTENPTNSSNGLKKRSRSPSDEAAEPPKNSKRPNTGTSTTGDEVSRNVFEDDNMLDDNNNNDSNSIGNDMNAADEKERSASKTGEEHTPAGTGTVSSNASSPTVNQPAQVSINSSGNISGGSSSTSGPTSPSTSAPASHSTASAQIHMRCLIVTQDASIIIGKKGTHVNEIREKSGARVVVSESIPGNPERILNVSGPLDAVSKAFGLIVRRINDEPFDAPSVPGSRAVTIKFMIPNSRMGSVIGKQGTKIKEIQDASGARLNASEGMLPGSTERVLSVAGVADAIHIATYYIGNILIEANERMPSTINSSYRPQNRTRPPSSMQTTYPYSAPYTYPPPAPHHHHHGVHHPPAPHHAHSHISHPHSHTHPHTASQPLQTQQIYIPNDLVGCIIGKGGSKINEIRQMSASQIKIMEPGAVGAGMNGHPGSENERLVVITGQPANIQMAVGLLYQRLEQEKQKQMMQAQNNSTSGSSSGGPMR
ncbi:hypothetical protein Clacol_006786 [Clathrus columnatus]|uniref:K Homology domain-containing protein n=1 Tax=Clathrus columnatus TaxID=1419009 RepID=A0AAV5AGB0_9AGAM|nr:hypothetical protein Clacol_006786 [Clathrus columnatus]